MTNSGKDIFGKGFDIKAEITKGHCPVCESYAVFVSLHRNFYRCMNCGGDTEQKVNGVISYIPAGMAENKPSILTQNSNTPEKNG